MHMLCFFTPGFGCLVVIAATASSSFLGGALDCIDD